MSPASIQEGKVLHIRKYPNRRYYDITRSCHVTLQELYELIRGGHDVSITDSRTEENITNHVLLQIILEKDEPKLHVFPHSVFCELIRVDLLALQSSVDRLIDPLMAMLAGSREQSDAHLNDALQAEAVRPDRPENMGNASSRSGPD